MKIYILDTTLCDKVCKWLATGRRCSPDTPDRHYLIEIFLKVALNTIAITLIIYKQEMTLNQIQIVAKL